MSSAITQPPRKRFTRSEVAQMDDAGLFAGQRLELIDGDLIDKMGQNPPHARAIRLCMAALVKMYGADVVQVQLPIEASGVERERSLPEPDLAVMKESKPEFARRHPNGSELALAVEIADSTLRHDSTTKRDLYARAGVREYWVLDLTARRLLVHRSLDVKTSQYTSIDSFGENDTVSGIVISSLLP